MAHPNINWTKSYNLKHIKGSFNVYVSSHKTGYFYGAVLYYIQKDSWADATIAHFEFKSQQFVDQTEEGVFNQCKKWIDENLKGEYKIELKETIEF